MKKVLASVIVFLTLALSGCLPAGTATAEDGSQAGGTPGTIFMYLGVMVLFFVAMYFIAIRPEKKRQKEQQNMLSTLRVGDTVLTTSGFYGVVIDITEDTVVVEFGNNKNCRIPMQRAAIVQLEHPEGSEGAPVKTEEKKEEKKSDEKKDDKKGETK